MADGLAAGGNRALEVDSGAGCVHSGRDFSRSKMYLKTQHSLHSSVVPIVTHAVPMKHTHSRQARSRPVPLCRPRHNHCPLLAHPIPCLPHRPPAPSAPPSSVCLVSLSPAPVRVTAPFSLAISQQHRFRSSLSYPLLVLVYSSGATPIGSSSVTACAIGSSSGSTPTPLPIASSCDRLSPAIAVGASGGISGCATTAWTTAGAAS